MSTTEECPICYPRNFRPTRLAHLLGCCGPPPLGGWKIDHPLMLPRKLSIQHVVNCIFEPYRPPCKIQFPHAYDRHGFYDYYLPGLMSFLYAFGVHLAKRMLWEWCLWMCIDQKEGVLGKIVSYKEDVSRRSWSMEDVLKDLRDHPIAALIHATRKFINHKSLTVYSHDAETDFSEGKISLHAVFVIGYGYGSRYDLSCKQIIERELYFIIQNSWGTEWGHMGIRECLAVPCLNFAPFINHTFSILNQINSITEQDFLTFKHQAKDTWTPGN